MPSDASGVFASNISRVDDVLSFHSKEQDAAAGPPPGPDRSLVLGAIALVYASWEAYIEESAVEVTAFLATHLEPDEVPTSARDELIAEAKPWALAGDGWRQEWKDLVSRRALGVGTKGFGLNTAGPHQVIELFNSVGVDPFMDVAWQNMNAQSVKNRLAKLIQDRSAIVHTAQAPAGVGLNTARGYRDFSERLVERVDVTLSSQAGALVGSAPW